MSTKDRANEWGPLWDDWRIQEFIEEGSGGETAVFRIVRRHSTWDEKNALKVVNVCEESGDIRTFSETYKAYYYEAQKTAKEKAEKEVLVMHDLEASPYTVEYKDFKFVEWQEESSFGMDLLIRMKLLTPLDQIQKKRIFTEEEILKIGKDICQALVFCDRKNIVHRDIKPANIFMAEEGTYMLGDFGISRIVEASQKASTGHYTLAYAPQEQIRPGVKPDKRMDIYSFGLTLYEFGNENKLPFASSPYIQQREIELRLAGKPLPKPSGVSKELGTVILKACAYRPEDRYQSAQEFLDALNGIKSDTTDSSRVRAERSAEAAVSLGEDPYETVPAEKQDNETVKSSVKPGGILMKVTDEEDKKIFGSSIEKESITSIVFSDKIENLPTNAWNVSENKNGSVMAWEREGVLHICGNGGVKANTDCSYLFYGYKNLRSIDFGNCFDTSQVTDMSGMFCDCGSLTSVDVSKFDTSQVTKMLCMFYGCGSLTSVDVSKFNTSQVTDMSGMFCDCGSLTSVDVSKFDTSQVTDMSWMFSCCGSLTSVDVSKFDTSQVRDMNGMFYGCGSLTSVDVSGFDTSQVEFMSSMFSGCGSLTSVDVSGFDTSQVRDMSWMFSGCGSLTSVDVSKFDTSQVRNMSWMFSGCGSLTRVDVSGFDTSQVTSMSDMFKGCSEQVRIQGEKLIQRRNVRKDS